MAASSMQGLIHVVMLIAIITFACQYHQLGLKYEDLQQSCSRHRYEKNLDLTLQNKLFVENEDFEYHANTQDIVLTSSLGKGLKLETSASEVSHVDIYKGTDALPVTTSKFIAESPFDSNQAAFHTTVNDYTGAENSDVLSKESVTLDHRTVHGVDITAASHLDKTINALANNETFDIHRKSSSEGSENSSILPLSYKLSSSSSPEKTISPENFEYVNRNTLKIDQEVTSDSFLKINDLNVILNAELSMISSDSTSNNIEGSANVLKTSVSFQSDQSSQNVLNNQGFGLTKLSEEKHSENCYDDNASGVCDEGNNVLETRWSNIHRYGGDDRDMEEEDTTQFEDFDVADSVKDYDLDTQTDRNSKDTKLTNHLHSEILNLDGKLRLEKEGTSIFCNDLDGSGTSCHIQNLCYKPDAQDFVLLKSDSSVIDVSSQNFVEGQFSLSLSSIPDHNAYIFKPVTIPGKGFSRFSVTNIHKTSFLMSRFKPDNIMHVIHDDLFPLIHSLHSMKFQRRSNKFDTAVIFSDLYDEGDFLSLYSGVTTEHPILLWKEEFPSEFVCFDNVYLGLSNQSLWYQYGFEVPQGPLPVDKVSVGASVSRAAKHIADEFSTQCLLCGNGNYIVFLSRKDTRVVLNEAELIVALARSTKMKVMSVSLETHTVAELITIVKNAKGIIGMHGSLLSLISFLHPGSVVIELFPYAINPTKYTPFKTLCDLAGYNLFYKAWVNTIRENSMPHSDWPSEDGGILHLSPPMQNIIMGQTEVPDHLCCEDPSWLYHIYQDTWVDVDAVVSIVKLALSEAQAHLNTSVNDDQVISHSIQNTIIPGPVGQFICSLEENPSGKEAFIVSWKAPWNVDFVTYENLTYNLVFQQRETQFTQNLTLPSDVQTYSLQHRGNHFTAQYNVWLRAVFDDSRKGPPKFVACGIS